MPSYTYETHIMEDTLLPFIFHRSMTAGQEAPFNWHENIEILCCIEGMGYVKCNLDTHHVQAGDIFVVNSDSVHSTGTDTTFVYHCLIVDDTFCRANGIPVSDLYFQELIRDEALFEAFIQVEQAFSQNQKEHPLWGVAQIRQAVLELLILLCRDYAQTNGTQAAKSVCVERVKKAMTYIKSNLSKSLSLDEIADHVGISKYHFSREFKAFTGETVIDSINILRCKEAKRLIESGMTVSAAAMSCGFENLSYFSRTFKKHFGQLPSKFLIY